MLSYGILSSCVMYIKASVQLCLFNCDIKKQEFHGCCYYIVTVFNIYNESHIFPYFYLTPTENTDLTFTTKNCKGNPGTIRAWEIMHEKWTCKKKNKSLLRWTLVLTLAFLNAWFYFCISTNCMFLIMICHPCTLISPCEKKQSSFSPADCTSAVRAV